MVIPDDFVGALSWLGDAERDRVLLQVVRWLTTGEEPDLEGPAMAVFEAGRRSIDKANAQSAGGRRGGQRRAARVEAAPAEGSDRSPAAAAAGAGQPSGAAPDPSPECAPDGSDLGQASSLVPSQGYQQEACREHNVTRTEQNGTEQGEGRAPARAVPDLCEVRAYFAAQAWRATVDPEDYFDNRQRCGWVDPQGRPILDWHADARSWARRQPSFDQAAAERSRARGQPADPPAGERWRPAKSARERLAELDAEAERLGVA